jgi:hypothetical protein
MKETVKTSLREQAGLLLREIREADGDGSLESFKTKLFHNVRRRGQTSNGGGRLYTAYEKLENGSRVDAVVWRSMLSELDDLQRRTIKAGEQPLPRTLEIIRELKVLVPGLH